MSKRTTRGQPPAKRSQAPRKRAPARRRKAPGALDKLLEILPFGEKTVRRMTTWGVVLLVGGVAFGVASWFGVPAKAGVAVSEVIGDAGFRLDKIDVTGLRRMDRNTVYAQALDQKSRAMPLIDLAGVRARLLQYPWIEDARVSRRLPDTMVIHIVEREPAAVWQNHGRLLLVDIHGVSLESVSPEAMPDLPLLVGDGANLQEAARRDLMAAAPALRPLVKASTWIGNRRWDLSFDTGEKLQLPEGEDEAKAALVKFAELDNGQRLLDRGYLSFDMRDPDKLVLRRPAPSAPVPQPVTTASQE